jgi:anthranilate synthase component 2
MVTGKRPVVWRNDDYQVSEVASFDAISISPGPGLPHQAGITCDVIRQFAPTKKILGVCLGHQAIGEVFGGTLGILDAVLHGVQRNVNVLSQDDPIFKNIPSQFMAGRYHSWVIKNAGPHLNVIANDDQGNIMAVKHRQYHVYGVQFHPESIMTSYGLQLIKNWINHT